MAGSTGRLGARIVRELLADPKLKVRAGKAAHDTAQRLRQALNSTHTTPSVLATTGCGRQPLRGRCQHCKAAFMSTQPHNAALSMHIWNTSGWVARAQLLDPAAPKKLTLPCNPTGARNTFKANEFAETAKSYGMLTPAQAKRLTVVPVDLEDEGTIAAAIGNAGRVSWGGSGAVRLNTC